jgi:transposase
MACCPSTSSGFIRGVHGQRAQTGGAGAASPARRAVAPIRDRTSGGGTPGWRHTHLGVAVGEAAAGRRHRGAERRPKRFGRPRRLTDAQCAQLIEQLKAGALSAGFGTELWTLPRIRTVIMQRFAVTLTEPSVWRLLRGLGWSVQRPSGQARARDEKAIRTWKARRWPELKKSRRDKPGDRLY